MLEFIKENEYKEEQLKLNKKCKVFSIIRVVLAINFLIWIIYFISEINTLNLVVSILSFITLIIYILLTNKYYSKELNIKHILKSYQLHYRRRNYDFNALLDDGYEFLSKDNYMLNDLDIFGKKSLYQYLCQAKTKKGRSNLANEFICPTKKDSSFTSSILELGNNEESILIESSINMLDNKERNIDFSLFNNLNKKIIFQMYKKILNIVSIISCYITIILALLNIIDFTFPIIFIITNVITSFLLKCDVFSLNASMYYNLCDKYINVINSITSIDYKEKKLINISNKLSKYNIELHKVKSIFLKLSTRNNFIARILLNSLFPYDLILSILYNKSIINIDHFEELFVLIGEIEVLLSFSNIVKDTNIYTVGSLSESIEVKGLVHPLVKDCVPNDYKQDGGVILTGSNMSGKTTFMRTLGINQILFNACGLVCANSYFAPNLQVFTSLRASDELSEGVSTFYAEILRMKLINEKIKECKCLILIDEIFKGTNANDRINASLMVIDKLNSYNQFFIISTHDFELCDAKNVVNYHFNETYKDNLISFDYKIKEGKCNTKNAIYLLKMANIIE